MRADVIGTHSPPSLLLRKLKGSGATLRVGRPVGWVTYRNAYARARTAVRVTDVRVIIV